MPASAWPGTVQRCGYLPFFLKVTISLAVLPGWSSGVCLPAMRKSCCTWPMFLKTNVTLPGCAPFLVESLKKNSPPLTWTETPFVLAGDAALPLDAGPLDGVAWVGAAWVVAPPRGAVEREAVDELVR